MSAIFKQLSFVSLALASWVTLTSPATQAEADMNFGIDIQVDSSRQELEDDDANVTTVDIAPHFQYGNWDFSLDAPWISADANYVNSNFPSNLVKACSDPAAAAANYPGLSALAEKRRGQSLEALLANYCREKGVVDDGDTVSGMSDITAFARYGMLLDEEGIWLLSGGIGYKFDNGDAEKNLGSDTRNTLLEVGFGANYGKFNASLNGGVVFIDGGDEFTESSYNYVSLDMGVSPNKWFTLGYSVDYDESYYTAADDVTKTTLYLKLKPWQHVRLKVYTRDFGSADGYPEREYGGSFALIY